MKGELGFILVLALAAVATARDYSILDKTVQIETDLIVGDPAPPLRPARWVQGGPVLELPKGNVSVVLFWDHRQKESLAALEQVSDLQEKLKAKGITVIAQHAAADPAAVEEFLKGMPNRPSVPVALDEPGTCFMRKNWLDAADEGVLPKAFVVDGQGRVVWIESPSYLTAEFLTTVAENRQDLPMARVQALRLAMKRRSALSRALNDFKEAQQAGDTEQAVSLSDTICRLKPGAATAFRFDLAVANGDAREGVEHGRILVEETSDPEVLETIARQIVGNFGREQTDELLALAGAALSKAMDGVKAAAPRGTLSQRCSLARLRFLQGQREEAARIVEEILKDGCWEDFPAKRPEERKERMESALKSLKEGRWPHHLGF